MLLCFVVCVVCCMLRCVRFRGVLLHVAVAPSRMFRCQHVNFDSVALSDLDCLRACSHSQGVGVSL